MRPPSLLPFASAMDPYQLPLTLIMDDAPQLENPQDMDDLEPKAEVEVKRKVRRLLSDGKNIE